MKIVTINLSKRKVTTHVRLVKDILNEFPELEKLYSEIGIIIGNVGDIKNSKFKKAAYRFIRKVGPIVSLTKQIFSVRSTSVPPRGSLEINLSKFELFESWKRKLAIRHECCHLLHPKETSPTYMKLKDKYSMDYLKNFVRYRREYCAHLCIIKRYREDWLRSPIGFSEKMEAPTIFYSTKKKNEGKKTAVYWGIANIVHILSILYLYEHIPTNLRSKLGKRKEVAEKFLESFFVEVQKDTSVNLPKPRKWLIHQDFLSEETYFQKIQNILAFQNGSVNFQPSVQFSHVAIGGRNSWGSESMKKIRATRESDVTTIIRFDLPFSLLRLPDGSYEMKEDDYAYRFLINRIRREPEIAHKLTGWTPRGNIDIIGDRFGRFSSSRVEIQIPYRIDEEMWDYFCPNCGLEIDKSTTTCLICGSKFSSEKSRRPPLKKVKKKAIELINKFLDAYRFFFKDYFVEHIRYDDIVTYEIEYVMNDGTKASWTESFDLSVGSVAKAGTLTAKPSELASFLDVLPKLDEKIALRDYLLASAENRISTEEYHLAILESVIALEITLSEYILRESEELDIPKKEVKDLIRIIGIYGNLRAILRLLTKDKEQISNAIYRGCEKTIQKRNNIVHRAETTVTYNEAKKGIWNIKKMTDYIAKLSNN